MNNMDNQPKGIIVYRGMDRNHTISKNVWVTDSIEYAQYWAQRDYNKNPIVKEFILPDSILPDLCSLESFESIMEEHNAWQDIPDDSPVWENGDEDVEYDLFHDLFFPSKKQISILKKEGYKGLAIFYNQCYSILVFNGKDLLLPTK